MKFYKFQGTGNDFIIFDDMHRTLSMERFTTAYIAQLCDRRFGIGADGLMILSPSATADFKMIYFNSDGRQSTMCGNGGRCISRLFFEEYGQRSVFTFEAIDGVHAAFVEGDAVRIRMNDVANLTFEDPDYIVDTGSPHYVHFVSRESDLQTIEQFGRSIRYSPRFDREGINVNLVFPDGPSIRVATYERGVEAETLSCGTGVVASSLCHAARNIELQRVDVTTRGGKLSVDFTRNNQGFKEVYLTGPAERVFVGQTLD